MPAGLLGKIITFLFTVDFYENDTLRRSRSEDELEEDLESVLI